MVSEHDGQLFNAVNGTAAGGDGTTHEVRAWADVGVIDRQLGDSLENFCSFRRRKIG